MTEDILSAESITSNLGTSLVGRRVIYYPRVTSTMDVARQEARQGAAEGTVVIAGEQAAGRGRLKRQWLSPKGNVALSVILYPSLAYLPHLVMLASLAAAHTIEAVAGVKTQIKWPNDVLINGRKVCGILVETDVRGERVAYAIIGIGINVGLQPAQFPEISSIATSLVAESGRNISRVEVIRHLLIEMERLYLASPDGKSIFEEWRGRLVTLGRRVQVKSGESTLEGVAESVERDGSLMLRQPVGGLTRIIAGDVTLREHS